MRSAQLFAVLVGLSAFGAAAPAISGPDAQAAFERLDLDGDDAISWSEAYEVRVGEFMEMDATRDGLVTRAEFDGPARPLSAFDTDDDGTLQLAEFLEGHRGMFDKFDEDSSGWLTLEEFEAARAAARGE